MATSPLIEALLRRAQTGVGKINARGQAIGQALQPFAGNVSAYYGPIQGQESALGSALSGSQAGLGQQLGAQIGGALSGIQAPAQAVSQFGGGTATTGAQSGAAVGALSSADLERLHSQASAEQIYASALPRLAALAADQERRGFLADAQDDLMELAAQESERAYGRQQDQREWQRTVRQDKIERQRYQRETRYGIKQDRIERQQAARATRLAERAAAAEYGLDYQNTMADNATSAGNLFERQRHNRQLEAQAHQRERRQAAKDRASANKSSPADTKRVYDQAREYGEMYENEFGRQVRRVPLKAEARKRLVAEFGNSPAARKVIAKALTAAGY